MTVQFTVPGDPFGKQRPRLSQYGTAYTPAKTRAYEQKMRDSYLESSSSHIYRKLNGPIRLTVEAYFAIPKSTDRNDRLRMESGLIRPTKKPDLDNVIKTIDGLNGFAFDDDVQIVEIRATKLYTNSIHPAPCVTITLEELK